MQHTIKVIQNDVPSTSQLVYVWYKSDLDTAQGSEGFYEDNQWWIYKITKFVKIDAAQVFAWIPIIQHGSAFEADFRKFCEAREEEPEQTEEQADPFYIDPMTKAKYDKEEKRL